MNKLLELVPLSRDLPPKLMEKDQYSVFVQAVSEITGQWYHVRYDYVERKWEGFRFGRGPTAWLKETTLPALLESIGVTEERMTTLLRAAYHWGRDNGFGRSEKNFNDFVNTSSVQQTLALLRGDK